MYRKPFRYFQLRLLLSDIYRSLRNLKGELSKIKIANIYEDFIDYVLNVKSEINTDIDLQRCSTDYDAIITGSDQIWNFNIRDFSSAYLGDFIHDTTKTKLIAYAPSLGPNPENLKRIPIASLKRYRAISVRENHTKEILANFGLKNIELVVDPTLLLTQDDYNMLLRLSNHKNNIGHTNYAYYYTPGRHDDFGVIAAKIADMHSLKLLADTGYHNFHTPKYSTRIHGGPLDFIQIVRNADLIIGASFHLMVFAIIYHKPFYCIVGNSDSRMINLLQLLGLENRIVVNDNPQLIKDEINWEGVENKLSMLREKSKVFLEKALMK